MWSTSATVHTTVSTERIWTIYCNVAGWHNWDAGIAQSQLDGPFRVGTTGSLQPVGGPVLPFTLILVEEGHKFADSTPIGPGPAIIVRHELTPLAQGTQITHTIEIESPEAEHLAQEMGFSKEEVHKTVSALARYAEESHHD